MTAPGAMIVDRFGMAGSGLCAFHCALGGLLAAAPWVGQALHHLEAWAHPAFAAVLVPLTLAAMQDGSPRVRAFLGTGALLVLAALVGHDLVGHGVGTTLTLAGSALLVAGHRGNRKRCRGATG